MQQGCDKYSEDTTSNISSTDDSDEEKQLEDVEIVGYSDQSDHEAEESEVMAEDGHLLYKSSNLRQKHYDNMINWKRH